MEDRNIFLVRHIATDYNIRGVFMGRKYDLDIDESKKSAFLNNVHQSESELRDIVAVYCSPAKRCKQTAELLLGEVGLELHPRIVNAFDETDYGDFEGKTASEIRQLYPDVLDTLMEKPSKVLFPGGESLKSVQDRAWLGLHSVCVEKREGDILICTHVDVIKSLVFRLLGISIDKKRFVRIDAGSLTCLEVDRHWGPKLKYLNRC